MAIDFPASPTTNQTYTFGTKTWTFNGTAWQLSTTANVIFSNVAQTFTALQTFSAAVNITTRAYIGPTSYTQTAVSTNPAAILTATGSTYAQVAMINSTNTGSADFAAYGDNGTDASGWVDMGFTGSGFNDTNYTITGKNDGYVFASAVTGTGLTGNLVLATGGTGTTNDLVFGTGGFLTANEKMRFINATGQFYIKTTTTSTTTATGALRVDGGVGIAGGLYVGGGLGLPGTTNPILLNGSAGTSGYVLTSAGAGATPTWSASTGGFTDYQALTFNYR